MANINIAPTKSNLLIIKEQLSVAQNGYELLEQKREILVMELMKLVEDVKLLEREIDKTLQEAYPAVKRMLMIVGADRVERVAHHTKYNFTITEKPVRIAGGEFVSVDVVLPSQQLTHSFLGSYADVDKVTVEFLALLKLLTRLASIRTMVWKLATEVRKTQRRVNALDKQVIPQTRETKEYIQSVLEERERENTFVLKALKARQKK